jgi:Ca2+-binding EF-hand superfamily protein
VLHDPTAAWLQVLVDVLGKIDVGLVGREMTVSELFRLLDANGDGDLSFDELKAGLAKVFGIELTPDDAKLLFEKFDLSRRGETTLSSKHALAAPLDP